MNLTLQIWRQKNANTEGKIVEYPIQDISPDMSFLEMLDVLNMTTHQQWRFACSI